MEIIKQTLAEFWAAFVNFITGAGWTIVTVLAAAVIGIIVIRIALTVLRKVLLKGTMDNTLTGFIITVARFALWLLLICLLASLANIPLTPLVTALGAIALAVGLALKDSLSNLANGVMLIGIKPFKEGDYVDIDGVGGTVKSINLMTTELLTPDNKKVILPNTKITAASITNFSSKPTRRVDWEFAVSYDSDIDSVKSVILNEFKEHGKILDFPAPMARLSKHGESALVFTARAWVNNPDYWDVFWDINESVLRSFTKADIQIPYPQMDVHMKTPRADINQSADGKEDL